MSAFTSTGKFFQKILEKNAGLWLQLKYLSSQPIFMGQSSLIKLDFKLGLKIKYLSAQPIFRNNIFVIFYVVICVKYKSN